MWLRNLLKNMECTRCNMTSAIVDVISNGDKSQFYIFIRTPTLDHRYPPKVAYDPSTHSVKISGSGTAMYKLLHKVYPEAGFDYKVFQNQSCNGHKVDMIVPVPSNVPIFAPDTMKAHVLCEHGVVMLELDTAVDCVELPVYCNTAQKQNND